MPLEMKYFVLKPKAKAKDDPWAIASQNAMYAFADDIEEEDPKLARELRLWAGKEAITQRRFNIGKG